MKLTFDPASAPVRRIGLGLAALGRPAYINIGHAGDLVGKLDEPELKRQAHTVLDAAYAAGIRYFDAARSYGHAEAFLGSWLRARGLRADDITVASKWGYTYTGAWRLDAEQHEVKDLSVSNLRRQWPETQAALGDYVRLYQIHSATVDSGVLDDREVLDELARLRSQGVGVGLSVSGPAQRQTIERALEVGGFDAVQATYNLLELSAGPALQAAHDAGLLVVIKEAVANGRLAGRRAMPALDTAARQAGTTPDAVAIAAVLAQPWVGIVLSGAVTPEQLACNLSAAQLPLDAAQMAELGGLAEEPERYWETRSALPWN